MRKSPQIWKSYVWKQMFWHNILTYLDIFLLYSNIYENMICIRRSFNKKIKYILCLLGKIYLHNANKTQILLLFNKYYHYLSIHNYYLTSNIAYIFLKI